MKKLLFALSLGVFSATPSFAYTEQYFEGYREGLDVGVFIAYCQALTEGDYKDPELVRFLAHKAYEDMDEGNREWAREDHPNCTPKY